MLATTLAIYFIFIYLFLPAAFSTLASDLNGGAHFDMVI